jgi:FtsZ-interacting cell division protein YlmF
VGLPEVQSVGEYEARYGAYHTQQQAPKQQQQLQDETPNSPRIFRSEPKKSASNRQQQPISNKVRAATITGVNVVFVLNTWVMGIFFGQRLYSVTKISSMLFRPQMVYTALNLLRVDLQINFDKQRRQTITTAAK